MLTNRDGYMEVRMYKAIKPIAAGVGIAAVLGAGVNLALEASEASASTFRTGTGAGDTMTMTVDSTTLETDSFAPAAKATVPCGFAATGTC
jgi:hypothetical protein